MTKIFMDEDFLLENDAARRLYHGAAEGLPVIDYHCHLSAKDIYEDRHFTDMAELWLGGDHYKWRLMRSSGVEERYITGDAAPKEKFRKWAEALSGAIGNPLYHWSHLELKNYFGFNGVLSGRNAEDVWELCNKKLAAPEFGARNLIMRSNVKMLCTTDDPADDLNFHKALAADGSFPVKVLPAFRPDRALGIEKPDFPAYIEKLGEAAGIKIDSFGALCKALGQRIGFFDSLGCAASDHGLAYVPFAPASEKEAEAIFRRALEGEDILPGEQEKYKTALLAFLGREYHRRGWAMQLHFGVMRDISKRVFHALGPDAGIDAIGDRVSASKLAGFLNMLDETGELPKTILYSLNPEDNAMIGSVMGAFQNSDAKGKMQHGSAWWFNDHKRGMEQQLESLAALGNLSTFVGMLTDSRSFLSYARHEYFRRILCNLIGEWVENGEYPDDARALSEIIENICYKNAERYFTK